MKRRVGSTLVIAALLGAYPLRAAERMAAPTVRVEVRSAKAGQLEALRAAAEVSGVEVCVASEGGRSWLAISAGAQRDLAAALEALRRAAGAAGVKLRISSDCPADQMKAVSSRPAVTDDPRRPAARAAPAAVLNPPPERGAISWSPTRPGQTPTAVGLAAPLVRAPRGPPG